MEFIRYFCEIYDGVVFEIEYSAVFNYYTHYLCICLQIRCQIQAF